MITNSIQDDVRLLLHWVRFAGYDEEPCDIFHIDAVVFTYHRVADIVQVKDSHNIEISAAIRYLYRSFLLFRHPAINELSSLC